MNQHFTMTRADRQELIDGAIVRYRNGELGPISFQRRLREIGGFDQTEIDFLKRQYVDECCRNMRVS